MRRIVVLEESWQWLNRISGAPLPSTIFVELDDEERGVLESLLEQGLIGVDADHILLMELGERVLRLNPNPGTSGARVHYHSEPGGW